MRTRTLLILTGALVAAALCAADSARFSQSLTVEQRSDCGLDRLNSDQIAALDALVRLNLNQTAAATQKRDTAPAAAADVADAPAFSRALSGDQRRAAGLDLLSPEQRTAVDSLVAAQFVPVLRPQPAAPKPVEAVEFFPNRFEVHGELGLSFGGGSGYNSRVGWLNTTLLDTKTGTEIGVTIATGREKWNGPYRYRWDDRWNLLGLSIGGPVIRP